LACWGVNGGRAGRRFEVTIDPDGPNERAVDALADAEPVTEGEVIRIRTTGGGGWGDPLERPYDEVARDLAWGKVSVAGARADYGVICVDEAWLCAPRVDVEGSDHLRQRLRAERAAAAADGQGQPFFDRGPGYARLSGGASFPAVDLL
jgi:N-methylhydantoinase B